jgi:hypothetical protein
LFDASRQLRWSEQSDGGDDEKDQAKNPGK